ncbi:Nuclear pore complex protein Nup205 [Glycine soja]|uniref:Nuclear pore complex protein Nup205 n=1 Tax=Glycine soja TaxID=3848 RepID=A0A0B2PGL8_GLYSO|nr:Nuclear pore complex protein Nup205 [Glycine soja]
MVSPKQLLGTIESALLGTSPPMAAHRVELLHALRTSRTSLQSLLSYPPPKPSDRSQVQSKSVRLPDSPPISLDDQDVHIALKLSDDLHLNEVDCVRLLVSANKEWGLMGREPLEILRLAAGLWYTERRDLITSLHLLLRAVVLDQGLQDDILVDIQKYLEDLISSGLRQRLISLIKELNREEPSGLGGPQCESYVLDSRGSLVERQAVVSRERLILGHCLVLSILVVRTCPKDIKDIFSVLKDSASEVSESNATVKHQITFCLLFALVIAFVSDGLSTVPDKASVLSSNTSFRHEFHELVMTTGNDPHVEGFVGGIRLAWVVHLMLIQDGVPARETISSGSSNELGYLSQCLEAIFSNNVFQFLLDKVLRTASFQVYDMQFELNEIEARREQYPSTISFLNLINALIAEERDLSDRGRRFIGIFRFIYDHVFGPFPQRAYADPCEKWQLVGACLKHFHMVLSMYDIKDEDYEGVVDQSRLSATKESSPLQTQLPVLELLKDFMSGKTAFRNIMSILLPGVNSVIAERSSQLYGQLLENAVQLSLEIIILVLDKDLLLSDYWRPLYQVTLSIF